MGNRIDLSVPGGEHCAGGRAGGRAHHHYEYGHTQYDHLASRLIHEDIAVALPKLVDETIAENK